MVPLLPEPEETPEDGAMPEDDELDDEDEPEEDELEDLLDEDLLDEDLLDDEWAEDAAEDGLEVAFFAVEEVPVLVLVWVFVAAEAWVVCAPTTAAVAVAAVAARAVVQVIFLTRLRPAVLAWTACRKWELVLVMVTGKPARF